MTLHCEHPGKTIQMLGRAVGKESPMMRTATIQSAIRLQLMQQSPCTLETLLDRLPQFSWSEIFTVVDQLSREGRLVLRHPARFDYEVSIGSARPIADQVRAGGAGACDRMSVPADPCQRPQEE
jgi:hypothetical protein